ncbi:MAG: GNAT family N-acetyltransferase [Paracoccaceae bacterium]
MATPDGKFSVAPSLTTDRLILRALRAEDIDTLSVLWADPDVTRFIGGHALSREDTWRKALTASALWPVVGYGYWIAERKDDGRLVGQLGFADFKRDMTPSIEGEPELGYVFAPDVHGTGIAREACQAAVEWADANLAHPTYAAIISPDNAPSIRLAEKLGFERQPDANYRGDVIGLFRRSRSG